MLILFFYMFTIFSKITKSGTIPIYNNKIILVESMKHNGILVLPKGKIKKNESKEIAAMRETMEEAGLSGKLRKNSQIVYKNTVYFVLDVDKVDDEYEEKNKRKRFFMSYNEMLNDQNVAEKVRKIVKEKLFKK